MKDVIIEEKEIDEITCEKHASLPHRVLAGAAVLAGFGANAAPLPEKLIYIPNRQVLKLYVRCKRIRYKKVRCRVTI